jgi:carbonic anhydrase
MGRVPLDAAEREVDRVKNEVFDSMSQLIRRSGRIKAGVADELLAVEGAIYHGSAQVPPGQVEWLGENPTQAEDVGRMKNSARGVEARGVEAAYCGSEAAPLTFADLPEDHEDAFEQRLEGDPEFLKENILRVQSQEVVKKLTAGNERYMVIGPPVMTRWQPDYLPRKDTGGDAIVLCGTSGQVRSPEMLFQANPGELLVHRTCGAISGRQCGCALRSLESLMRQHTEVCLLLILGDVLDPVMNTALTQVQCLSSPLRPANAQMAIDQLGPSVIHAWRKACQTMQDGSLSVSKQKEDLVRYATELHAIYVQDRILRDSKHILDLCAGLNPRLQIQSAIVDKDGSVRWLGGPANMQRYVELRARAERHQRKGLGLSKKV